VSNRFTDDLLLQSIEENDLTIFCKSVAAQWSSVEKFKYCVSLNHDAFLEGNLKICRD